MPGQSHRALFSLDIAVRSLEFYEEFFDIKYPLVKSDNIAVPDFDAGAMENWGAITYRETALLIDEVLIYILNRIAQLLENVGSQ